MKETPIIFSAPMVRAILDGTKSQTRRIITDESIIALRRDGSPGRVTPRGRYGKPGDRLWVRETWGVMEGAICTDKTPHVVAGVGGTPKHHLGDVRILAKHRAGTENNAWGMYGPPKWHPSIHMPRTACRIALEITSVRIERLNEISASDAIAEGIEFRKNEPVIGSKHGVTVSGWKDYLSSAFLWRPELPVRSFESLWESINGKGSWATNPYVWAIEFRRVEA